MTNFKSYKFILVFLLVSTFLFSQTNVYKPFPQFNGEWIVKRWYNITSGGQYSWQKFKVSGDTVIGLYTYKKVTCANSTGNPSWNGTQFIIPFGTNLLNFGYRNDIINKHVYYLDLTGGTTIEEIWYDFNLTIGTILVNNYSFTNPTGMSSNPRRVVESIDSVLICGNYHKRFIFNCGGGFETELIEGVGFKDRFTQTAFLDCPFEPWEIYSSEFSSCMITSINDDFEENNIQLFPNPTSGEIKIKGIKQIAYYTITNNLGEIVLKGNTISNQLIQVSSVSNGIYILQILDKSGHTNQFKFIKQ